MTRGAGENRDNIPKDVMESRIPRQVYDKPDIRQLRSPHQLHKRSDTECAAASPRKTTRRDDKVTWVPHQQNIRTGRPDVMGPGTPYQRHRTQGTKRWTTPHQGHHHQVTEQGTLHKGSRRRANQETETPHQGRDQPDDTTPETSRPGRRTRPLQGPHRHKAPKRSPARRRR